MAIYVCVMHMLSQGQVVFAAAVDTRGRYSGEQLNLAFSGSSMPDLAWRPQYFSYLRLEQVDKHSILVCGPARRIVSVISTLES